jgi:inner membrane protein
VCLSVPGSWRDPTAFFCRDANLFFVDALSHALIAWILFSVTGLTSLLPFAILGAVIMDADIFFSLITDTIPSLYLFTHGGIAHSFTGALVLSVLAYLSIFLIALAGIISLPALAGYGVYGFAAILGGALSHLMIDVLACPGIPLLAPFADRKYTLGILPGPSILIAGAALALVVVTMTGILTFPRALVFYAWTVLLYLAVRGGSFLVVGVWLPGRKIPGVNPLRWMTITGNAASFTVRQYIVFRGFSGESVFTKYKDTSAAEVKSVLQLPEVRRLFFHSCCVIAERTGSDLILSDPLREKGYLYYPPHFKRVAVTLED